MASDTGRTSILLSFGAVQGGFEFTMQLREDIYARFGKRSDSDPHFCYLDAESLRTDGKTTYNYDPNSDKNMMLNPDWNVHYTAAMRSCGTMILLITEQWLISKWCWVELNQLISEAERRPNLKVIVATWPDAEAQLAKGRWASRQDASTKLSSADFEDRLKKLNPFRMKIAGAAPCTGRITRGYKNEKSQGTSFGKNEYFYSCSQAEVALMLGQIQL